MQLFSDTGMRRLDEIVRPRLLCAFDFDGTLAPIVPHPGQAMLLPGLRERLAELSRHADIAIVTGRALQDIVTRLGFAPAYLLGNHGIEGLPGWEQDCQRHRETCLAWEKALREALADEAFDPAIWVENKALTLSVHFRQAADRAQAAERLADLFQACVPQARVVPGKCVFNLVPPGAGDKGSALVRLMEISQAGSALYLGDDDTDEDAFRLKLPGLLGIRVGASATSAADFYLDSIADVPRLMDALVARLRAHACGREASARKG